MTERVPTTNFSDSWTQVDRTADPAFYPGMLDATRAQLLDEARRDPAAVFGPLELQAGMRVLDVGCGTGDYLRLLAPLVAPGSAVGIDISTTLIDIARSRSQGERAAVSFHVGDAYDLPYAESSYDRVLANQVLLHLDDPWRVVEQIRRVLAPGGRLAVGEWDWDSTCLAVTDRDLGRRFTHLLCDQMRNALIVRDLSWQLADRGFTDVTLMPRVRLTREPGAPHEWLIEPVTREFVRTGVLSEQEGSRLLDDLRDRAETGRYFLARIYYSVIATAA